MSLPRSHGSSDADGSPSALPCLLLELAISATGAEGGSFLLPTLRGDELVVCWARGRHADRVLGRRVRPGERICGRAARSRKPIFLDHLRREPGDSGGPSCMVFPLLFQERLQGILNLRGRQDGQPFSEGDFRAAGELAEWAAGRMPLFNTLPATLPGADAGIPGENLRGEFRNHLNTIHGAIYYLRRGRNLTAEKRKEFLDLIAAETRRLTALADL